MIRSWVALLITCACTSGAPKLAASSPAGEPATPAPEARTEQRFALGDSMRALGSLHRVDERLCETSGDGYWAVGNIPLRTKPEHETALTSLRDRPVLLTGTIDGPVYVCMELVPGHTTYSEPMLALVLTDIRAWTGLTVTTDGGQLSVARTSDLDAEVLRGARLSVRYEHCDERPESRVVEWEPITLGSSGSAMVPLVRTSGEKSFVATTLELRHSAPTDLWISFDLPLQALGAPRLACE